MEVGRAAGPIRRRVARERRAGEWWGGTRRSVGCRDAFLAFDKDRSGTIDVWELRQVLEAMGQKPTEEELFQMISEVDARLPAPERFGGAARARACARCGDGGTIF